MAYEDGLEREMDRIRAKHPEALSCRSAQQMQCRAFLSEAARLVEWLQEHSTAAGIAWLTVSPSARREFAWNMTMVRAKVRAAREALADSWEEFDE